MTEFDLVQLLPDLGSLGIMALFLYLFWTGGIVSKKTHEEALEKEKQIAEKTAEIIAQKLCQDISTEVAKGVRQGIVDGYFEINGNKKGENDDR